MRLKIKQGRDLLFVPFMNDFCNYIEVEDELIINFTNKYTFKGKFRQRKNHLFIHTTEGLVDLVFTGGVPVLGFQSYCKDQLVLEVLELPKFYKNKLAPPSSNAR